MSTLTFAFDDRAAAIDAVHGATALYTNHDVVDAMLDEIGWPIPGARLLDPSCGDGAFLVRAIAKLSLVPNDIESLDVVRGWEFHPGAVVDARENIANHLIGRGWMQEAAEAAARAVVTEADFLTDGPEPGTFDILIGNPPYLRFDYIPEVLQDLYARNIPKSARSDILHAFLFECARLLPANGLMSFVSADRWLFNETAAELREHLSSSLVICGLSRLDPSTTFYRPKRRVRGSPPRVHPVKVLLRRIGQPGKRFSGAPVSPDTFMQDIPEDTSTVKLADVAIVKIAPWMGPVGVFVIDRALAARMPANCLVPVVDTDDIDPDTDELGTPQRFAVVTDPDQEPTGIVAEHLRAKRALLPERAKHKKFWVPPERINIPLDRPHLLVPRIARRLRVVDVPAGVSPLNHNLSILQSNGLYSLADLKAILTSPESHQWLTCNAPRLENGFYSITTSLLRRLPVPSRFLKT